MDLDKAIAIKLLICDVDGVLTDGKLHYTEQGETRKIFYVQDGLGLELLQNVGIDVAVITAKNSKIVHYRMEQLGVRHIYQAQANKMVPFNHLLTTLSLEPEQVAYIGDDIADLEVMRSVGLSIAVANAVPTIKHCADWQTTATGGNGAVREICDLILRAQNKTDLALKQYLAKCQATNK